MQMCYVSHTYHYTHFLMEAVISVSLRYIMLRVILYVVSVNTVFYHLCPLAIKTDTESTPLR